VQQPSELLEAQLPAPLPGPGSSKATRDGGQARQQAMRRRTFAIISHPDAGKTTLTEKFLLYGGAVVEAGAVTARAGRRATTSDWMELEKQRGISVSSTVLQFDYRDYTINLLDTPGHRDFSEDTYRVLAAADAAIMVLDVAKGIEPQTLKLFEVCRARRMPVLTFLNKCDQVGRDPLELLDEIENLIGLKPTPVTWPVGDPGDFRGVIDRRDGSFVEFTRSSHGATVASEERWSSEQALETHGAAWQHAEETCSLFDAVGSDLNVPTFLAGETTPVFVGSALTNFGVRHLLDAVVDLAPAPTGRVDVSGDVRDLDAGFSGFVFKIQANMNPSHRDNMVFVRVCSGHFERGMPLIHQPTGRSFTTKYAMSLFGAERLTVDDAWPGDIVGLVNASNLRIGDSVHDGTPVVYPGIPVFAPELIATARPTDVSNQKRFRKGLEQMAAEGVIQILHRPGGDATPILAAVGAMQFEVLVHRLEHEFGCPVYLEPPAPRTVRRTDSATATHLSSLGGVDVLERDDGTLLALFASPYRLQRLATDNPEWLLDPIVST
jgi:peptide chain release factor 3